MIQAVIFDLDGVLVTTDEMHYRAWKNLAEELGIHDFTREDNVRQRGVSRMASLEVVLEKGNVKYTEEEKVKLADKKNEMYVKSLQFLSDKDILPGVLEFVNYLKGKGIKIAVGSASKNTPMILKNTGLDKYFDAVSCGLDTDKSKPHPDVFLIAADKLGVLYENCLVVEDSDAGIAAAKNGNMYALAVGAAKENLSADYRMDSLLKVDTIYNDLFE